MTSLKQTDDEAASELEDVIARSKEGDLWAFRRLVETYQRYAFTLAFRVVCDADDARDIVQEAFLRVWKNIQSFDPAFKFTTWLYRIVVNLSLDQLKKERRRRRVVMSMPNGPDSSVREEATPDDSAVNRDLADRIEAVAGGLPVKQRMVFVLRDLQDFTVSEVAEILEMSPASVKTNLCYARREIRLTLKRMGVSE